MTISVPVAHYLAVANVAARQLGSNSVRHMEQTGWIVHDRLVVDLLVEARIAHPSLAGAVVRTYVSALRREAESRGLVAPSPAGLIESFGHAGGLRLRTPDLSELVASALAVESAER